MTAASSRNIHLFSISLFLFLAVSTLSARDRGSRSADSRLRSSTEWTDGYSSTDGGLEEESISDGGERIYTLGTLENLRRSLPPRYVRVLDWNRYSMGKKPVEKGILFTMEGYRARNIAVAGDFSNWKPLPMIRNKKGLFFYILPIRVLEKGERVGSYKYKFLVDGIWTHDPGNRNMQDDGMGGYISLFHLDREDVNHQTYVHILREAKTDRERLVEFSIYLPDVENLSIVGNFNGWNPEHDFLTKGEDGTFRIRLHLRPGEYVYRYIADGKWIFDTYNPDTRYSPVIEDLGSYIKVR